MDGRAAGIDVGHARQLDRAKPYKPLDVGNGVVSGSLAPNGRWLSLGMTHPVHGRIELTSAPEFTGDRLVQASVRAYRSSLADPERASFGFDLLDEAPNRVALIEDSYPFGVVERPQGRFEITTVAPRGRYGAVQLLRIAARAKILGPSWGGVMRLGRAAYTQLTPGGALATLVSASVAGIEEGVWWIEDARLEAAAAIAQSPTAVIDPGEKGTATLAVALAGDRAAAIREALDLAAAGEALVEREIGERRALWRGIELDRAEHGSVRRGLAYALDCAATRSDGALAVLADHQILPLVWTRDAYYVCRAMLSHAVRTPAFLSTVEGFARWLFTTAERVGVWWPRASFASGQVKDPAFQLDQQLYPLLLVADHARITEQAELRDRYAADCARVLESLLAKRSAFGLIATDETPADDPLVQPYHFSSHVLLWRVLAAFGHAAAAEVKAATLRHFTTDGRFAYAIAGPDGQGARHYHDANDLPTVFAPGWGLCAVDDPVWLATIAFAWSERNEAYFTGPFGGLGSVHTPHPWPLGDLQDIVVARALGDAARERRGRQRLDRVETWDLLLPEAYDERSCAVVSRHWFAWPAALRCVLELEPMLTAP